MDEMIENNGSTERTYRYVFRNSGTVTAQTGDIQKYSSFADLKADLASDHPMLDALLDDTPYLTIRETEEISPDGTSRLRRHYKTASEEAEEDIGYTDSESIPSGYGDNLSGMIWYVKPDRRMGCIDIKPFNDEQKRMILRCINEGLEPAAMSGLDKNGIPIYNTEQMRQILAGIEAGLSDSEMAMFSDPKYSPEEMEKIRLGLINSLGIKKYGAEAFSHIELPSRRKASLMDALNSIWVNAREDYDMLEC